jgi:hypothetical protein
MTRGSLSVAASLVLLLSTTSIARADQFVFSTLPAQSGKVQLDDESYDQLFGFVPSQSGWVNSFTAPVEVELQFASIWFELYSSIDARESDLLVRFPRADFPVPGRQTIQLRSPTRVHLTAGTMYFLVVNAQFPDSLFEGSAGITGPMLWRTNITGPGEWQPLSAGATPAFALGFEDTEPVPEPATMLLVLGGLAGLLGRRATRAHM